MPRLREFVSKQDQFEVKKEAMLERLIRLQVKNPIEKI